MNTSKKSSVRRALTAMMWLPSIAVGAMYALAWNHLPADGFGFPGTSRGWPSRGVGLIGSLVVTGGLATLGTAALSLFTKPDLSAFAVVGFFYMNVWAHLYVNYLAISLNFKGNPINIVAVLVASIAAAAALIGVALLTQGGATRHESGNTEVRPQ